MELRPILSALMRNKTGPVLVAVQVALSLAILANALHVVNLRQQTSARPSGVADEHSVFYMRVRNLDTAGFEQVIATREHELATLRAVPGVVSVAEVNQIPLSNSGNSNGWSVDRNQLRPTGNAATYDTTGNLIKTWGLKLVEGRDFRPDDLVNFDPNKDASTTADQVIITSAIAQKAFPGQSAVGKSLYNGTGEDARTLHIIGVVERLQSPWAPTDEKAEWSVIRPLRFAFGGASYSVRAEPGQRDRVMREAEEAIRKSSPTPKVITTESLDEARTKRYASDRALSWTLITVSGLLLLVTASGIVGMASLWVTQRRKQIGVRRALGARRIDILRYFITENLMITSTGVVAGVLLAIGLNNLMVSKLEMVRLPLGYLGAGAGLFWALGLLAVYGPAWRAASISPALATRTA
ncbi:ABC transporter permease [Massilia terrae]|uniref:FtsX-like permease family protein n=1 Tax=Massilia terrae TaxID=1811224 RepID=A0ABT2CXN2_9BURK|nr:FtsX-like permease family protein [Massilia terrae]MCS0658740.1 FtsX-like permease family protein [Massilia terrae]